MLEALPLARPFHSRGDDDAQFAELPLGGAVQCYIGSVVVEGKHVFLQAVPENQRESRADMIATANAYFDAIQRNTGHGYYPFTDDCLRHENGIVTAGPPGSGARAGCAEQLRTTLIGAVTGIRDRRFVAVDRERGIVFSFAFFDHRPINWTWQLGELFKIENNKIRQVEAIFIRGPYGVCSGWSTYEQCRSEKIQDER